MLVVASPAVALSRRSTDPPSAPPPPVAAFDSHSTGTNSASNPPPPLSPPTAAESNVDHATSMALSAARRDLAHMKAVLERHKDVEGGLSSAALIAALKEVDAPVPSSSDGASEDLSGVPSPSTLTRSTSAAHFSGAFAPDLALLRKLSDAAASSLKRKDKVFMGEVFSRHAKPLGLSADALLSALHAIAPSSFSADVSDAGTAAKKLMRQVDIDNKGHATLEEFEKFCRTAQVSCDQGTGTSPARDVFVRFADVNGLSPHTLMGALKEVNAPVLLSSGGCSPEQIFRRADANISGSVDLAELDAPIFP